MPWGVVAGAVVGGVASGLAAESAEDSANAAAAAQEAAAEKAWSRSLPWDVAGSFGTASFTYEEDPETGHMVKRDISLDLSEELQKEYDYKVGGPERQRAFIEQYQTDPDTAAQAYYDRYKQIVAPEQQQQRLGLESRLLGQGMLGSTGGAGQMQSLTQAQLMRDYQARTQADAQVQGMIDTYRTRGAQDLAGAVSLGDLPYKYAILGGGQGAQLSSSAQNVAGMMTQAANTRAQAEINTANAWGGAVSGIAGAVGSGYAGGFGSGTSGWGSLGGGGGSVSAVPQGYGGGVGMGNTVTNSGALSMGSMGSGGYGNWTL